MNINTPKPFTDEQLRVYSKKAPADGYPPIEQRLTIARSEWQAMVAAGQIAIKDDPRYYIAKHPHRLNCGRPGQVKPPISADNPPTAVQNALWDSMNLKRDTLGRALHPRADQLLTTPYAGMYTGPGYHYTEGPQLMGNMLFRILREGRPHYAMSGTVRDGKLLWGVPGGYFDNGIEREDRSVRDTAIFETHEETGIDPELFARMTFLEDTFVWPKGFKKDTLHAWGDERFCSAYSFDEDDRDLRTLKLAPLPAEKDTVAAEFWDMPAIYRHKEDIMETHFEMIIANEARVAAIQKGL